jgi:CRISPR type III-A-associated protein Csm2
MADEQVQPKESRPPKEGGGGGGGREGGGPREGREGGGGRGPREGRGGDRPGGGPPRGDRPGGGPHGDRGDRGERRGGERGDRRFFEGPPEIELDKLIGDSLYLDNQAHAIVSRMRDMDSGTKSQLRRLYSAVRRAVRAPESERQHEFVMLRARLAYTIARHGLRSLDQLEKLLLQVTRKNDGRGYERFKDLFEAIVAYNE